MCFRVKLYNSILFLALKNICHLKKTHFGINRRCSASAQLLLICVISRNSLAGSRRSGPSRSTHPSLGFLQGTSGRRGGREPLCQVEMGSQVTSPWRYQSPEVTCTLSCHFPNFSLWVFLHCLSELKFFWSWQHNCFHITGEFKKRKKKPRSSVSHWQW